MFRLLRLPMQVGALPCTWFRLSRIAQSAELTRLPAIYADSTRSTAQGTAIRLAAQRQAWLLTADTRLPLRQRWARQRTNAQ